MFSPSLLPGEVAFPAVRGVGRVGLAVLDFLPDRLLVLVRRLMAKAKEMPTECLNLMSYATLCRFSRLARNCA